MSMTLGMLFAAVVLNRKDVARCAAIVGLDGLPIALGRMRVDASDGSTAYGTTTMPMASSLLFVTPGGRGERTNRHTSESSAASTVPGATVDVIAVASPTGTGFLTW